MWVRSLSWENPLEEGGHGNPLQYSCLESPMDRGAWWATIHRVTQSWTPLKRFSTAQPRNLACHLGILNIQMIIKRHSILRESFFFWGGGGFISTPQNYTLKEWRP